MTAQKIDPLADKRTREADEKASADKSFFAECAHEYIAAHRSEWKSSKYIQQWENTLATYAFPIIGNIPIGQISAAQVCRILSPIWETKHETANRLRGRIEAVIDWASAHGLREGDNPARWKGHLEHLLARSTIASRTTRHHPALPHASIRAFMAQLVEQEGMARWALEFLILTATRTSEVKSATWSEADLERSLWIIPAERMKAGKEHRVPLCKRACEILITVRP
jgi:integrase